MTVPEAHRVYVPAAILQIPPEGQIHHFKDCWWVVHPERGIAFYVRGHRRKTVYAQCNSNAEVAMQIRKTQWPDLDLVLLDHVYLRVDHEGRFALPKEYLP